MLNFLRIFMALGYMAGVPTLAASVPDTQITRAGEAWAGLKYQSGDSAARLAKTRDLIRETAALSEAFPQTAGLLYWRAQLLCLEAELMHSLGSLDKMGEARDLLEKADQLDPRSSTIKALLGSVYYEVPGWPLGFGSDKKASAYLAQALALEPDGMDSNFFMGDFLLHSDRAAEALVYFEKAAQAAERVPPSRVVMGRRQEISEAMEMARKRAAQ